jgi:phosphoesterase RecJ-like protein
MDTLIPQDLLAALRGAQRVAIAGHVTPDADCVGAIAALWLALPELGLTPHAALPPATVARKLTFLVDAAGLTPATPADVAGCDLLVAVDTAKESRLNLDDGLETVRGLPLLNIDHHATNTQFGRWNWVDGRRSSSSEMVYEVLRALECRITPTIATLLYAGIHSDTQGFSLGNTTPRSLQVGYELAAAGARVHEIGERLERSHSPSEFALLRVVYANTRVSADGRLAWSTIGHDELTTAGCGANDIDNQVEIPRAIEGIRIALLLSEGTPGKIRVNFRGEPGTDVLALAREFGGGGHHASAGAIINGQLAEVTERVVAAARAFLAQHPTETQ